MKLIDKLKNALFEEEYVEVEEKKPKAPKKEKPIAKKIVLPEQKKEVVKEEEKPKEVEEPKKDFKFPAILEDDFIDLTEKKGPMKEEVKPKTQEENNHRPLYGGKKGNLQKKQKKESNHLYGAKESDINIGEYGGYEKKTEKKEFKPSPIISPVYGVLDQNYKKEDIVTRKSVRVTTSYSSKNIDIDSVMAKAHGSANDDIFEEELVSSSTMEDNSNDNTNDSMLDISDNTPEVAKVTVGDAEEYFDDLGLEYNIDYKDASHEKATGRRSKVKYAKAEEKKHESDALEDNLDDLEDNLFDLIDSMYEDKKGE